MCEASDATFTCKCSRLYKLCQFGQFFDYLGTIQTSKIMEKHLMFTKCLIFEGNVSIGITWGQCLPTWRPIGPSIAWSWNPFSFSLVSLWVCIQLFGCLLGPLRHFKFLACLKNEVYAHVCVCQDMCICFPNSDYVGALSLWSRCPLFLNYANPCAYSCSYVKLTK